MMTGTAASDDASDDEEKEDGDDEGEGSDDVCEAKECGELCGYSDYGYGDDDGCGSYCSCDIDDSSTSVLVTRGLCWGAPTPPNAWVGAPHQCLLGLVASCFISPDIFTFR